MSINLKSLSVGVVEIQNEEEEVFPHFARDISFSGTTMAWTDSDAPEDTASKVYTFLAASDNGDHIELSLGDDSYARVRPLDPYDGVRRSRAGVPQPLEVLQAEVLRGGGVVAQELSAVVAEDNTVVTLMLETGIGTYVRFSGDWQRLSDSSSALEDTYMVAAAPTALGVFDAADMANVALNVFDLPRRESSGNGADVEIDPEEVEMPDEASPDTVIASGTVIPEINDADGLEVAIRYANTHPASRWYVAKRAHAMGLQERVPMDWSPSAVVRPF